MKYAREELNAVYASAPVGLCVLDSRMRFVRINGYLAAIHGIPADEHIGRTLHEVVPHVAALAEPVIHTVMRTGEPALGAWSSGAAPARKGIVRRLDGRYVPIKDGRGRISAVSIVVQEAAARRPTAGALRAEEAGAGYSLKEQAEGPGTTAGRPDDQKETLQKIIDNIPLMLIFFNSRGIIEYVSPSSEELSGYRSRDLIGKIPQSFGDEAHEYYRHVFEWVKAEKKAWSGRRKTKKKSGEDVEVGVSVSPVFDERGAVTHYIVLLKDITQEVKLHQHLAQTQKLEAIGTLAGGIAHDLKNIFTPILLNTELALQDVGPESPTGALLQDILEAVELGNDLVNQIITFSRRDLQMKKPVDISSVVRDALSFLRAALPSTIEMASHIVEDGAVVMADPMQIKQVLMNLGSNAAHAMREKGGTLEVTLTGVVLEEKSVSRIAPDLEAGPYVQITVRDTGVGMDESTRQRIFDPFFTTKDKSESMGMGLSVVHGIIKDHKGVITVQSRPGRGSVFTILLPCAPGNLSPVKAA